MDSKKTIEYKCNICNKFYKTYQTLWKHNKKFHNNKNKQLRHVSTITTPYSTITTPYSTITTPDSTIITPVSTITTPDSTITTPNIHKCKYCNNIFSRNYSVIRHEKICKIKPDQNIEEKKLELEEKKLLLQLKKEETKILQLKLKLEKSTKIDNITLKKLNKMLIERNNKIKNSFNTINNQIINNFQLVEFGKEEVIETLTNHDKKIIMNARYNSLDNLIKIIHCGKYNQFKNIIITNMKDNYMYKYDD